VEGSTAAMIEGRQVVVIPADDQRALLEKSEMLDDSDNWNPVSSCCSITNSPA
jgi:hypothetical protein